MPIYMMMNAKFPFAGWIAVAASLCAASYAVHAATQATFTDSWKDAPVAMEYPQTTGSFSFKITLPVDGELTVGSLDSNSEFSISIGPTGSPFSIVSGTLGDARKFTANKNGGSATFAVIPPDATNLTTPGNVTVSWTAATITVSGSFSADILGGEASFATDSDGIPADSTVAKIIETNEVTVTLDTFSYDNPNVPGTVKNTETEHANPDGSTVPLEAGSASGAANGISFTDTWKDAAAPIDYAATAGLFSFRISLPVAGKLAVGSLDSNSPFSVSIGPTGSPLSIVSGTLGDARKFIANKNSGSATFAVIPPDATSLTAPGNVTVSWTAATMTVTGSFSADILGEEASFVMDTDGIPADSTFAKIIETNEVSVMLDTFSYDNPNVPGTVKNTETEHANPDGSTIPLEAGLASGAATGVSFTDTWKDTAANDYQAGTTGSGSLSISLPLSGLPDITSTGLVVSNIDTNSVFSISVGPLGNPLPLVSGTMGSAQKFTANKNGGSAVFPIFMPYGLTDTKLLSNGVVTVSWTATTIAVTGSFSADIFGEDATFASNSDGKPGTQAISGIYEMSLILDASGNDGGTFAYDNPLVPVAGKNTETEHTNVDGATFPMESGRMTGTADFIAPKVAITTPKASFAVSNQNSILDVGGTASDNVNVASVRYYLNGDTAGLLEIDQLDQLPTNSLAWTAEVNLSQSPGRPGTNVFTVYAVDTSGNVSLSQSRTFSWIQTNAASLSVNPAGAGTVKGIRNGQVLQVGSGYSVTATPANKSWIFSQWTNASGVLSSSPAYNYIDTDGALAANFAANPFTNATLAGAYAGLFFNASGMKVINSGSISIKVTGAGGYTGQLYIAPASSPFGFSGQLAMSPDDLTAEAAFNIKVSGTEYLEVSVEITNILDPGGAMLGGSVAAYSDPTETYLLDIANIQGKLCLNNTNVVPGAYNVSIPGHLSDPSYAPGGYSFGTATVSSTLKGAVTLVLNLADGTSGAVSCSSSMARDGTCPFYHSLYGGKGVILGWLRFATNGPGAVQGYNSWWVKEPLSDKYYTKGFALPESGSPSGALYVPPKAGSNLFGATALTFVVDGGLTNLSLPNERDFAVTFNPAKNTFTDTNKVTLNLIPSTGALSGSFYPAGGKTPLTFHGLVVGGAALGFYADTNYQTGPVSIDVNNQ